MNTKTSTKKASIVVALLVSLGVNAVSVNACTTQKEVVDEVVYKEEYKSLTEKEIDLVSRIVYWEGYGESEECKRAIIGVILNRYESGIWGETVEDVVYAKDVNGNYQFEVVPFIEKAKPDEYLIDLVKDCVINGSGIEKRVMFFRADYYHKWAIDEFNIDSTYFSSSPWYQ